MLGKNVMAESGLGGRFWFCATQNGVICRNVTFKQSIGTTPFEKMYGKIGSHYIDAHHLVPLSKLRVGVDYKYSIANDFAVLCANCHRMIHRSKNPSDLIAFKKSINFS